MPTQAETDAAFAAYQNAQGIYEKKAAYTIYEGALTAQRQSEAAAATAVRQQKIAELESKTNEISVLASQYNVALAAGDQNAANAARTGLTGYGIAPYPSGIRFSGQGYTNLLGQRTAILGSPLAELEAGLGAQQWFVEHPLPEHMAPPGMRSQEEIDYTLSTGVYGGSNPPPPPSSIIDPYNLTSHELTARASAIASPEKGAIAYGMNNYSNTLDLGLVNLLTFSKYAPGTTPGNPAQYGSSQWYKKEVALREATAIRNDPNAIMPSVESDSYYMRIGSGEQKVKGDLIYSPTGEWGVFRKTYDPITGLPRKDEVLFASGGRNALQAGALSLTSFYPTTNARYAELVKNNPSLFSRPGAEMYGGMILPLAMRTYEKPSGGEPTITFWQPKTGKYETIENPYYKPGTQYGVFPSWSGNLAKLVDPNAVNRGRESLPSVNIPGIAPVGMFGYGNVLQMTRGGAENQPTFEVMGGFGIPAVVSGSQQETLRGLPKDASGVYWGNNKIVSYLTFSDGKKMYITESGKQAMGGDTFAWGLPTEQAEPQNISGQPVPEPSARYKFLDVFTARTPLALSWSSEANPLVGIPAVLSRADPYLSKELQKIKIGKKGGGTTTVGEYLTSPETKNTFGAGLVTPIYKTPATTAAVVATAYAVGGGVGIVASDLLPVLSPVIEAAPGGATFIQSFVPSTQLLFGGLAVGSIGYDVYRTPEPLRPFVLGKDITITGLEAGAFSSGFSGTYNPTQPVSYTRQLNNAIGRWGLEQRPIRYPEGYGPGVEIRAGPELITKRIGGKWTTEPDIFEPPKPSEGMGRQIEKPQVEMIRGGGGKSSLNPYSKQPPVDMSRGWNDVRPPEPTGIKEVVISPERMAMIEASRVKALAQFDNPYIGSLSEGQITAQSALVITEEPILETYTTTMRRAPIFEEHIGATRITSVDHSLEGALLTEADLNALLGITKPTHTTGIRAVPIIEPTIVATRNPMPKSITSSKVPTIEPTIVATRNPISEIFVSRKLFVPEQIFPTRSSIQATNQKPPYDMTTSLQMPIQSSLLASVPASALTQYPFQGTIRMSAPIQKPKEEEISLIPGTPTPTIPWVPFPYVPQTPTPGKPTPDKPLPIIPIIPIIGIPILPSGIGGGVPSDRRGVFAFTEHSPTITPAEMGRSLFTGRFVQPRPQRQPIVRYVKQPTLVRQPSIGSTFSPTASTHHSSTFTPSSEATKMKDLYGIGGMLKPSKTRLQTPQLKNQHNIGGVLKLSPRRNVQRARPSVSMRGITIFKAVPKKGKKGR